MTEAVNNDGTLPELEALADALPTAMLVVNRQGMIFLSNSHVNAVLGLSADLRLDGLPMWQALPVGLREMVAAMQREVLIYAAEARRDYELTLPDGTHKLIDIHLAPVNGSSGQPAHFCLVISDARDRQEVVELKKLDHLKSNFLSMISHELRTPLTSIRGAVHLLGESDNASADPAKALVGIIRSNSDRLIRLVNNLLEMVAIDNDTFDVSRSTVEVRPLVLRALQRCEAGAKAKFIGLDYEGDECSANVDPERFVQFIFYLVDNAIKFTPHGGRIRVMVGCRSNAPLQVNVSDTGCGIPAYARDKIFDKFYQVEDPMTRCTGGTGVGLYLARYIVLSHGGQITVQSNPEGGSDFHAQFPDSLDDAPISNMHTGKKLG